MYWDSRWQGKGDGDDLSLRCCGDRGGGEGAQEVGALHGGPIRDREAWRLVAQDGCAQRHQVGGVEI